MAAPYDSYNYQAYWENRSYEDDCERLALTKLFKKLKLRESLVDIGGGFGRLSDCYCPRFKKCLVLDPSQKLLKIGRQKTKAKNLSFRLGSLPNLPLKDKSFAVALLIRVSHHLPQLLPTLKEIHRILKKDGFVVIEVANKIHFPARIKAFFKGDFNFVRDWRPVERRSPEYISQKTIAFSNHHPQKVVNDLKKTGFLIVEMLSVSNFRSPLLKKVFPESFLLFLEKKTQELLAKFFFGPSIFILAKKE
ncbi:MAG TPA: class I SAM-dependent methyltransferase [Clostridia bacterium]|nr:class I SAM-dependent methyltransferase [Clostridia bacterium]